MNNDIFNKLAKQETDRMLDVMCTKSNDYAKDDDKLFNFKQAGKMDGISPVEALRGMWLKHRASIQQGLDELLVGKSPRARKWWIEKLTDDRNYNLLLLAQLDEQYFIPDGSSPLTKKTNKLNTGIPFFNYKAKLCRFADDLPSGGHMVEFCTCCKCGVRLMGSNTDESYGGFTIKRPIDEDKGWYVFRTNAWARWGVKFLHKDLELREETGYKPGEHGPGEAPGYYMTKQEARKVIDAFSNKPVYGIEYLRR